MDSPRFTNLLAGTAAGRILSQHPLLCVDIGSRGGVEPELLPIAFAVDAIGFDSDPQALSEVATTTAGPWRSQRHLPWAIAATEGEQRLHIPVAHEGASLLEHDSRIGDAFDKPQFFTRDAEVSVQTRLLDPALAEAGIGRPAFLKLDVEGCELDILRSAPQSVASALAVKTETAFIPFRRHQPLASDVDQFLRAAGFVLMDIVHPSHWRTNGYVIHPQADRQPIPYSRGQLVQADFLYFRSPETIEDPERRFQAAAIAMAYGFFDHAQRLLLPIGMRSWLIEMHETQVDALVDEVSRIYGRAVWQAHFGEHIRRIWTYARSFRNLRATTRPA